MVENRSFAKREEIYRWFSVLDSAQRAEFLCGLLDLCVPIELRFFGSCLEDLARKDYHSLRDAEIKANNPADLANLTNITDEVVRSKLLVSLALLSSDNRVAAGVLFRTLTHIDTIINNYGLRLNDGRTGEQFLLLFTMASNHPAFSFHQKRVLRQELTQIQEILLQVMDEGAGGGVSTGAPSNARATFSSYVTAFGSCQAGCPCCKPEVMGGQTDEGAEVTPSSTSPIAGKSGKEHVERIELRGVTAKADACVEKCVLEASWSDSSSSTVSKSLQEVQEFFSQVSQLFPEERLENLQPLMPGVDSTQELDLRCFASLPPHVLKHDKVRLFFSTSSAPPLTNSTNMGCLLQFRGARPVCGVASIRPVLGLHAPLTPSCPACLPHLQPHTSVLPILPSGPGEGGPHAHPVAPPPPQPRPSHPCPEQNGILDWLRKLRLHKYYPVFKQLTMEEFLALTEEDLNKYDLTQGAKKKLKTQLELQKEKLEKRYTLSQFPIACGGGVARVTPSSHIHTATHTHPGCSSAELRVEVENGAAMLLPLDSGSSSGYSSSPSSPMTPLSRDLSFDRVKRAEACGLDPGEKERTCFLLNPAPSGPARPTAQVLPVQNDPNFCLPPPSLSFLPSGRIISAPRKPRPPPQGTDERSKPAVRLENLFPALSLDASPAHQEAPGPRGPFSGGVLYSPARPPGVPVAAIPGNTYSVGATPSATPTPASTEGSRTPCVCSSCGCGGGCGSYGTVPASYFPHFSGTSVFTLGPLLHFSSSPFSYPLVAPPLYGSQQSLVLPPVQGFVGGGVYQPLGMLGNGSAALKKAGNASCYNCGVSGHRAQDCKQPAMDSAQQGSFRLKYSPQSDSQDSAD